MEFSGTNEPAVPAATVVVLRDTADGVEALMLRRSSKVAFGGMWVFPGGRVDAGDRDPDRPDDELAAARRAAVREAAEEAGIGLDGAALAVWSHWTPPPEAPRRYTTWFFVAPASAETVEIDGQEIHEHAWWRPPDALARQAAGEVELAPPTWVTLWYLGQLGSVADAVAAARARTPERYVTRICFDGDRVAALWGGDAAYDDGDLQRPGGRHRLWMTAGGWQFEVSGAPVS